MKFKENSIFTKTGRLKRKIDKTEKFLELLTNLEASIASLVNTCDIRLEELRLSEEVIDDVPKREIDTDEDNDIDCCEFDFINKLDDAILEAKELASYEKDNIDRCVKIDNQDSKKEEVITAHLSQGSQYDNVSHCDKFADDRDDMQKMRYTAITRDIGNTKSKRTAEIRHPNIKDMKVTINKQSQTKIFPMDDHVKTAMKVLVDDNVDLDTTLMGLKEEDIILDAIGDGNYSTKDCSVVLTTGLISNDIIDTAIFKFNLNYVPHGPQSQFFNKVLHELELNKVDPKWKSIGFDGCACAVQIDDEIIAVNISISGKVLYVTFVYNVHK